MQKDMGINALLNTGMRLEATLHEYIAQSTESASARMRELASKKSGLGRSGLLRGQIK